MAKPRILYFYPRPTTFVRRDMQMLEQAFDLKARSFYPAKSWLLPWEYFRQYWFLWLNIWTAKAIVVQFAGHQSVLPSLFGKVFGKPTLIVASGADAASFPAINYGNFRKKVLGAACCFSYRLASHISPVHASMIQADYTYAEGFPKKQGILNHCPKVKNEFTSIPYGLDPDSFKWSGTPKKRNSFLMAAFGLERASIKALKGLDIVLETARLFPEGNFTVIGYSGEPDFEVPENVDLRPPVDVKELPEIMSQHRFYLQLSLSEGFPNALCEAMLCECVPIGSAVTSIPEIIGETGFVLEKRDAEKLKILFAKAVQADGDALGKAARNRIRENFNWARRERELTGLVEKLIKK